MLDDIVGFSEQGFSLYLSSMWNLFDLGILLIFSVYIALRTCSLVVSPAYTQRTTSMAYDTLASAAILLFPRLFSQLDHYPYFSSLLLAFRLMAADLVAIAFLIAIACSGFYIAFALSFGGEDFHGESVAMALFQILMGFRCVSKFPTKSLFSFHMHTLKKTYSALLEPLYADLPLVHPLGTFGQISTF